MMMMAAVLALATSALAQSRGVGRISGVVEDESGKKLEGVQVKAVKQGETEVFTATTNDKGEWAIGGLAGGEWNLDFSKDGFVTRQIAFPVNEYGRSKPIEMKMKIAEKKVDPNAEIRTGLEQAAKLMQSDQFVEARKIYEDLLAKYPEAWQIEPLIARTYAGTKQPDEAMKHLQVAQAKDPENVEVKLLMASVYVDQNNVAEAQKLLDSIDMTKVKDPVVFLNTGITLINQGKAEQALPIFNKVVEAQSDQPEGYYYRARAYLAMGKFPEAKADLEKFISMSPPDSPQVAEAKKILEQLK
jgi:tetratricopeptide (TPR) repeat protein